MDLSNSNNTQAGVSTGNQGTTQAPLESLLLSSLTVLYPCVMCGTLDEVSRRFVEESYAGLIYRHICPVCLSGVGMDQHARAYGAGKKYGNGGCCEGQSLLDEYIPGPPPVSAGLSKK